MLSFIKKHWILFVLIALALAGIAFYFGLWKVAAAAVGSVFALLFGRRSTVATDLAKMEQIRRDEEKKISDIRDKERADLAKNDAKLDADLKKISDEDKIEKKKISDEKQARTEDLSKKSPDDIADELAKKRGFKIIRPEE